MDAIRDGKLVHKVFEIPAVGNPRLTRGKINNALQLDGDGQYLDIGAHGDSCLGNLKECKHGLTGSMWANFKDFEDNMYFYSNGQGARIFYRGGKLHYVMEMGGKRWQVTLPNLSTNRWYFLEHTWHPTKGLSVYLDNQLVATTKTSSSISSTPSTGLRHVYIGRANTGDVTGGDFNYANMLIDNVDSWYSHRDYLTAFGYLNRGILLTLLSGLQSSSLTAYGKRVCLAQSFVLLFFQ